MKRPALAAAILTAASFPIALAWPPGAWAEGDAGAGRKIAETHCARCHVVGDFNPMGGIGSTPSFQLLAKRNDWLERFENFLSAGRIRSSCAFPTWPAGPSCHPTSRNSR